MQIAECKKCGKEFERDSKARWVKQYCSRSCANSRTHSAMTRVKQSSSSKELWEGGHYDHLDMKEARKANLERMKKKREKILKEEIFENLSIHYKRIKVLQEQDGKCLKCGLSEWLGKPISFELDHINGTNTDNRRENLRFLCPNCHSQTDTWRGRNKKNMDQ